MSDDMANNWGCNLVTVTRHSKKRIAGLRDHSDWTCFQSMVANEFGGKFELHKVTPNGSDANLYAVNYLTKGNNKCCLIACGSYVAGDRGPLHSWTTSTFSVEAGPSGIMAPEDVANDFTKEHTIALPYHMKATLDDKTLKDYEDECMNHLHIIAKPRHPEYQSADPATAVDQHPEGRFFSRKHSKSNKIPDLSQVIAAETSHSSPIRQPVSAKQKSLWSPRRSLSLILWRSHSLPHRRKRK